MLFLAIFAGGAVGTLARYSLSLWVSQRAGAEFPWGTLAVNLLGSLLLGLVLPFFDAHSPLTSLRAFVTVGCISAFTTYSTFAFESVRLIEQGRRRQAAAYVAGSVTLGLICIAVGLTVSGFLLRGF
jgi:fluoride exporter